MRLCEAAFGALFVSDGEVVRLVAMRNVSRRHYAEFWMREPARPCHGELAAQPCMRGTNVVHVADLKDDDRTDPRWRLAPCAGRTRRIRTILSVAAAQGRRTAWGYSDLPPGGAAVFRQADRAAAELRRPGGDRDGERAADHRDSARRWSSRPRPPRCCRSSTPRPAIWRRCSMRCWKRRCGCAVPRSASFTPYDGEQFHSAAHVAFPRLTPSSGRRTRPGPMPGSTDRTCTRDQTHASDPRSQGA